MSTVLFAWELGRGFGHLTRHLELVRALRGRGHRVVMAVRDLAAAERIYGAEDVVLLPAPFQVNGRPDPVMPTETYADILYNQGFGDPQVLRGRIRAWRELFDFAAPAAAVFDHGPTALLASRSLAGPRIQAGSGFTIPPRMSPLPPLRYWAPPGIARLEEAEARVLAVMNAVLDDLGEPGLTALADLFATDEEWLLTFPELDHYPQRSAGEYLGATLPSRVGAAPHWPAGSGPRIFAYVHAFAGLQALLQALEAANVRAIVFCPDLHGRPPQPGARSRVFIYTEPLDLHRTASEADLGITNGTLGTTTALLLAGTPLLMLPDNLERVIVAHRVSDLGAGIMLRPATREALHEALGILLAEDRFAAAAAAFAARHADWAPAQRVQHMLADVEGSDNA